MNGNLKEMGIVGLRNNLALWAHGKATFTLIQVYDMILQLDMLLQEQGL
jgi:hypothetical protein